MPIYEYQCLECGHQKDVLQKVSDEPLVDCPACGKARFAKKISAPGFQLKGTGWYETDFKNKSTGGDAAGKAAETPKKETSAPASKSDSSDSSAATAA